MNIVVTNKKKINWCQAKLMMNSWLRQNIYWSGCEWVYKDVPRRIIAEKYLEDEYGELRDYKFFCFHGEPEYMEYDIGRGGKNQRRNFYDMEMIFIKIDDGIPSSTDKEFPLPKALFNEMKDAASALSKPFDQVRVDFYAVNNKIYFGEMTFFDGGGSTIFTPDEWNYKFSEKWIINS